MLSWGRCDPGLCLKYVWLAYKEHGASADGFYATATAAWEGSPGKHWHDRNPPAGVPVYFGPKPSSDAGDVVISLGGGRVAATDWPRYGVIGITTIDERQAQIDRPYLGWTDNILGYPIAQVQPPEPPPEEEEDMSYSLIPISASEEVDIVSLVTGNRAHIENEYHLSILERVKKGGSAMLRPELDIARGYLQIINPAPGEVEEPPKS
jgi:hypothetical protein